MSEPLRLRLPSEMSPVEQTYALAVFGWGLLASTVLIARPFMTGHLGHSISNVGFLMMATAVCLFIDKSRLTKVCLGLGVFLVWFSEPGRWDAWNLGLLVSGGILFTVAMGRVLDGLRKS